MTTEDAFLADICSNPDDDGVRLIYADWLTERDGPGDSEQAEFIRVQCAFVRTSHTNTSADCPACILETRARDLLSLVQDRLRQEWRSWADERHGPSPWWEAWEFRRGFVEHVTLKADDWCRYAERLLATQPIREVRLTASLDVVVRARCHPLRPDWLDVFLAGEAQPFATVRKVDWMDADRLPGGPPRLRARVALLWPGIVFHGPDFPETSS
jgi:uncharacterized protein (TIGR02996 family)